VGVPGQAVNALRHPEVGELFFDATTLTVADHPCWHLVLYNPRPGTNTQARLERLHHHPLPPPRDEGGGVTPTITAHCMPSARVATMSP
jgi:hypothetical protein